jgi:hypothetical protein
MQHLIASQIIHNSMTCVLNNNKLHYKSSRLPLEGATVAAWLKLTDGKNTTTLIDLDKVIQFDHNSRDGQVLIHVGSGSTVISEKASPMAYHKVLTYMRQLEQSTQREKTGAELEASRASI